eukprot:6210973-Pleurochrysis_carterae.AAC.2
MLETVTQGPSVAAPVALRCGLERNAGPRRGNADPVVAAPTTPATALCSAVHGNAGRLSATSEYSTS